MSIGCKVSISLQKDYVDRGVQTDHPIERSNSSKTPISNFPDNHCYSKSCNYALDCCPLGRPILLQPSSDPRLEVPTESNSDNRAHDHILPLSPKIQNRAYKYSNLTHPRHIQSNDSVNRVVSLPETRPASNVKIVVESGLRIVSMPECRRLSSPNLDHSQSLECSSYLNDSSICTDKSGFVSSQTRRRCRQAGDGRYSPSEIPQTPSQPSSPESIMIIGNKSPQVPRSFLRPKPISTHAYTDDDGWISWASSPPRPIPALHGPLSLPYARCPSGAEGTVIEGEDQLPHMIWGLDTNNTRLVQAQQDNPLYQRSSTYRNTSRTQQARPHSSRSGNVSTFRRTLPPCIDISYYYKGHEHVNHPDVSRQRFMPAPPSCIGSNKLSNTPLNVGRYVSANKIAQLDRTTHIQQPLVVEMPESMWDRNVGLGLGLDWKQPFPGPSLDATATHASDIPNTNLPIDAFPRNSDNMHHSRPRIFIEPRKHSGKIQTPRRMSALDIAHRYHAEKLRQNVLPTPPSTSSPLWTQTFSDQLGPSDVGISFFQHASRQHSQNLSRLQSMYALDDRPQELQSPVEEARRDQIHPMSFPRGGYRKPRRLEALHNSHQDAAIRSTNPSLPANLNLDNTHNSKTLTAAFSAPRGNILGRQPCPIPLTGLIQRRLSVVPEESSGRESCSRPTADTSIDAHSERTHLRARSQSYPSHSDSWQASLSNIRESLPPQASTPANVVEKSEHPYPSPLMSPAKVVMKELNISVDTSGRSQSVLQSQTVDMDKENGSFSGSKSRTTRRKQARTKNKNINPLSQPRLTTIRHVNDSLW